MSKMIPKHILKYPTPLHIFYSNRLKQDAETVYSGLRKYLPNAELYYSTKTNSLLTVLKTVLKIGYGLEVIAAGDLKAAILAGANSKQILLNGAAWSKETMEEALYSQQIGRLHLDSFDRLDLLTQIISENKDKKIRTAFGVRVHEGHSHFGIAANKASLMEFSRKAEKANISIESLHIHRNTEGGPQSLEKTVAVFKDSLLGLLRAKEILASLGEKISLLDIGGGLETPFVYRLQGNDFASYHSASGLPEGSTHFRPTLQQQSENVSRSISEMLKEFGADNCKIAFEPGRSVVTRALSTLVEVMATKDLYPDAQILITNGNTSILGPLHRAIHPVQVMEASSAPAEKTFVYGNLPHASDWLAQGIPLSRCRRGSHILFENTGAYFLPLESNFGYPRPGIFDSEEDIVLRSPEDIFALSARDKT